MPLTVKNPLPHPVIYGRKGEESIIWDASGDPSGGDVQEVSDDFAQHADFLKSVSRGVLEVIDADDPEVLTRLRRKTAQHIDEKYADAEGRTADDALKSFDRVPDRSIVSMTCVGPDQRGSGVCGTVVMVAPAFAQKYPPLCPPHGPLQPEFVRDSAGKWVRKVEAAPAS